MRRTATLVASLAVMATCSFVVGQSTGHADEDNQKCWASSCSGDPTLTVDPNRRAALLGEEKLPQPEATEAPVEPQKPASRVSPPAAPEKPQETAPAAEKPVSACD